MLFQRSKLNNFQAGLMGEANMQFARGEVNEAIRMCMEVIRQGIKLTRESLIFFKALSLIWWKWTLINMLKDCFDAVEPVRKTTSKSIWKVKVHVKVYSLTLKVLNFWKLTSYCRLKPLWSGMGELVLAPTSPTLHPPSPPTLHQLSRLAL